MAQQALLDSAIDFCTRSNVIAVDLDPISVIADITDYELDVPTGTRVAKVLKVWYDGKTIEPSPYEATTAMFWTNKGDPRFFYGHSVDETFTVSLLPIPLNSKSSGLRVRVALAPTRTATSVHSVLFDRYAEGIVAGAIGIIAAIPDQQFTDVGRAMAATSQARAIANTARGDTMHGNVQSSLSVRMRAF